MPAAPATAPTTPSWYSRSSGTNSRFSGFSGGARFGQGMGFSKLGPNKSGGTTARPGGPASGTGAKTMSLSNSKMSSWKKKEVDISVAFSWTGSRWTGVEGGNGRL